MKFPEEEINELIAIIPSVSYANEGGYDYLLLEQLKLPDGCQPAVLDVLLCPNPREGYQSRLFFASEVIGGPQRNWNSNIRALGRNWYAVSWATSPGLKLIEMLAVHLKALRHP
jgi:hypothetical protein